MKPSEILRWVTAAGFGAFGLYVAATYLQVPLRRIAAGDWWAAMALGFPFALAAPTLAISYFALRRQSRGITVVVTSLATLLLFLEFLFLPSQLGMDRAHFTLRDTDGPLTMFAAGLLSLTSMVGPLYLTPWFFGFCLRFASRYIHGDPGKQRPA